jgi:CheY-like chemotaxis protein
MKQHTVLILEDEEDLREMLRQALELNGYMVVCAPDGQSALDQIDGIERICLVLLDLVMPGMNGWTFYEQMRLRPRLAAVPVIVHSSSPGEAPLGVARVLRKPLKFDRLLSVVQEFCG